MADDALIHARWHRALDDLSSEPDGPIRDHIEQHDARVRRDLAAKVEAAEAKHRDLTSRLGFGDNITEPQADNDAIVEWFEQQSRDANEWQESQLWRNDCYVAGHPDDEDCFEHDPMLRLEVAEAKLAKVEALLSEPGYGINTLRSDLRALLADALPQEGAEEPGNGAVAAEPRETVATDVRDAAGLSEAQRGDCGRRHPGPCAMVRGVCLQPGDA